MNKIQIIQGGQYGSEAKGTIAAHLVLTEAIDVAVRTGATNAGHTVYYKGERYTMQQLPVGWVRPETELVIGAGAIVDIDILHNEIALVNRATGRNPINRLYIDPRAYVHGADASERSAKSGRHHAIGATGKGCSEALRDRIRLRGVTDGRLNATSRSDHLPLVDTEKLLNDRFDQGASIQLEGTQGQLLDIALGPYPFTTHKQTGPAQWMLECGLSPGLPTDIVGVFRTCPIRVAGNSGPLPRETSWDLLAAEINERRMANGDAPLITPVCLDIWRGLVEQAAANYATPERDSDGLRQHEWLESDRTSYREALSEINAQAWAAASDEVRAELSRLWELTTVTQKPRRIARWSGVQVNRSVRQMRPNRIALTFWNYLFPSRWYSSDPLTTRERDAIAQFEITTLGVPICWINRGPLPEHIVEVEQRYKGGNA